MQEIEEDVLISEVSLVNHKSEDISNDNLLHDDKYVKTGKRFVEILFLTLIALPLLLLISIIFLSLLLPNKGKVTFKQQRIGINGKPFSIFKFRTLSSPVELDIEKDATIIKMNSHPIGIFLRRTGFDEILQIINVIKGEMSLIGPRPLIMNDLKHLTNRQFKKRHSVKPGILGLWQIRRKYIDDKNYFRYDEFYIRKQSLALDSFILLSTLTYIVKRKGR